MFEITSQIWIFMNMNHKYTIRIFFRIIFDFFKMKITQSYRIMNCTPVWLELSMSQVWKPSGFSPRTSKAQLDGRCGISAIEFDVVVLCQCLGSRRETRPMDSQRVGQAAKGRISSKVVWVQGWFACAKTWISGDFRGCLYCLTTPTKKDEQMVKPLNHVEPFEALSC